MNGEDEVRQPRKQKKNRKKLSKRGIIQIVAAVVVLFIMLILFIYTNNTRFRTFVETHIFRREVHENNLPEISISRGTHVYAYNGRIITLEQNTLRSFRKKC